MTTSTASGQVDHWVGNTSRCGVIYLASKLMPDDKVMANFRWKSREKIRGVRRDFTPSSCLNDAVFFTAQSFSARNIPVGKHIAEV